MVDGRLVSNKGVSRSMGMRGKRKKENERDLEGDNFFFLFDNEEHFRKFKKITSNLIFNFPLLFQFKYQ